VRFAYADPPYLGCGHYYPERTEVDHAALLAQLVADFPDGWALSCSSPSLRVLLPLCPPTTRVLAWVKPFASFRPHVNPAYVWEPVLVHGGRPHARTDDTIRDWHAASVRARDTLIGAKPASFCSWLLDVLNVQPNDELIDLFPGTGIMGHCLTARRAAPVQLTLTAPDAR
jgi:hypothetical protein